MRYFIEKECPDDGVMTLNDFKMTIGDDIKEIELLEMKREYGGEMWCKEFGEFPERCFCGIGCQKYDPCNGRSGKCRHLVNGFVETGREFVLTEFGLKEV